MTRMWYRWAGSGPRRAEKEAKAISLPPNICQLSLIDVFSRNYMTYYGVLWRIYTTSENHFTHQFASTSRDF